MPTIPESLIRNVTDQVEIVVREVIDRYRRGIYSKEDHMTGALVSELDRRLNQLKSINGVKIIAKAFNLKEEIITGADLGVLLSANLLGYVIKKAFIAQAKICKCRRTKPRFSNGNIRKDLLEKCQKMLNITPSSFVIVYTDNFDCSIQVFPASEIIALNNTISCSSISDLYSMKFKRLFEKLLRCETGDPQIVKGFQEPKDMETFLKEYKIKHGLFLGFSSEKEKQEEIRRIDEYYNMQKSKKEKK